MKSSRKISEGFKPKLKKFKYTLELCFEINNVGTLMPFESWEKLTDYDSGKEDLDVELGEYIDMEEMAVGWLKHTIKAGKKRIKK